MLNMPFDPSSININFWVLQTIAMALTALLIPGLKITSPLGALAMVVALAFVNSHIWDAALFFSIPDHISSHVLLLVGANAAIFWVLVKILPGIESSGIVPAIVSPLLFTLLSVLINTYGKDIDWMRVGKQGIAYVESVRDQFRQGTEANAKQPEAPSKQVR